MVVQAMVFDSPTFRHAAVDEMDRVASLSNWTCCGFEARPQYASRHRLEGNHKVLSLESGFDSPCRYYSRVV